MKKGERDIGKQIRENKFEYIIMFQITNIRLGSGSHVAAWRYTKCENRNIMNNNHVCWTRYLPGSGTTERESGQ